MTKNEQLLVNKTKGNTSNLNHNQRPIGPGNQLRKRHWFLGSLVVLTGSWITHTTTATIAADNQGEAIPQSDIQPLMMQAAPITAPQELLTSANNASIDESLLAIDTAANTEDELIVEPTALKPELVTKEHTIKKGESLGSIFRHQGLDLSIPHHISKHPVAKQLTSIRTGKTLGFGFNDSNELKQIRYPIDSLNELLVSLNGNQIEEAAIAAIDYDVVQKSVSGEISSSLYLAGKESGLSNNLIMEMVRIFGWDIDFVQDIRSGDSFHVIFEEFHSDNDKITDGDILAAEFTTQGQTYRAIRFEDSDGIVSYFNQDGESMLGTFLRTPVEFSRISSRFGKRKHPISKKWKAHKGVDYAAPRGTPIRATADGKVVLAGRKGGYGKTVVLRHAGRFSTLYAHMNGFAQGVRSGTRVKQGQVIGYVGSTGMSTGPHLHYEFRVDGAHRNPLTYKTPKASAVSNENKTQFKLLAANLGQKLDQTIESYQLAKLSSDKGQTKKI